MMKRRDALKAMGGIAGAATLGKVLPGCGGGDSGPVGITTMVFMMMENRSYDHAMGARSMLEGLPGNGLTASMTNLSRTGTAVPLFEVGDRDAVCVIDPPHGWDDCHLQFNAGANDGFVTVYENRYDTDGLTDVMGYLTRAHQPVTWALADGSASCDNWFCSVMGPTWPNRMYWHTGTSQGISDNSLPSGGFNWQSIYHKLVEVGVEYAFYYGDVPVGALIEDIPGNIDRIFRMEDFFNHCEKGTLPPVVYIDPAFSMNDDHPPKHTMIGQQLIASIYTALASSPQWKNIMFVLTYDEHGGYFDHVAPPTDQTADEFAAEGFDQLGFRVPALVMGPYVKAGQVISTQYDHCSALKHIENFFGTAPLAGRVTAANDLIDCIDLERLERGDPLPPVEIPAVEINEGDITDACSAAAEVTHDVLTIADRFPEIFKRFDRRGKGVRDDAYLIGDFLEKHNKGRIIRGK